MTAHLTSRSVIHVVFVRTSYKDTAVITQLYYQVYITYQLHVSAIAAVGIFRLDTILSEKLYRYDMTGQLLVLV
jgi:hypothetical protein